MVTHFPDSFLNSDCPHPQPWQLLWTVLPPPAAHTQTDISKNVTTNMVGGGWGVRDMGQLCPGQIYVNDPYDRDHNVSVRDVTTLSILAVNNLVINAIFCTIMI